MCVENTLDLKTKNLVVYTVSFKESDSSNTTRMSEVEGDEKEHVVVGKSIRGPSSCGSASMTFKLFGAREICMLHVHHPSDAIPTHRSRCVLVIVFLLKGMRFYFPECLLINFYFLSRN